jgi:uncharacterized membrane protein
MAHPDVITPAPSAAAAAASPLPAVLAIGPADLMDALRKGWDDFSAMPTHVIFLSLIYPIVGLALARATFGYALVPLLYPLAAGFALFGPLGAIGLYELSRRRELGLETSWDHAFEVFRSPSLGAIAGLGLLLVAIFLTWIAVAHAIYTANFGYGAPASPGQFLRDVFGTPAGHSLILWGNGVGFLFAVLVFVISVVSFPLLLDRHVSATAAIGTSVRAVAKNPGTMSLWAAIVVTLLVLGSLPFLVGLAVVMPVLGHSTWHLYRKVVEPNPNPGQELRPRPPGRRYAAEFPVSLFMRDREHP